MPLKGRSIVIYGASGSIGTAAVQLAKHFGAHVTAVCNTKNLELVRSLGADVVIDYTQEDFTKNGKTYDVVFDAVGKHSFRRCRHSLKPGGIFIETDLGFMWHVPPLALATRWIGDKRVTLADPQVHEGGRPPPQGADRGWQVPRGHRPAVSAGARRRGDEVRRDGAEDRKRRTDGHMRRGERDAGPPRNPAGDPRAPGHSAKARPRRTAWCSRHAAAAAPRLAPSGWPGSSSGSLALRRLPRPGGPARRADSLRPRLRAAREPASPGLDGFRTRPATASRRPRRARARRCRSSSSRASPASRAPLGRGIGIRQQLVKPHGVDLP